MKELPHQELRNQYFEEKKTNNKAWKNWQYAVNHNPDKWHDLTGDPCFAKNFKYRRKPKYININGFAVSEPYRGEFKKGDTYFSADPMASDFYRQHVSYLGVYLLNRGFIHLDEKSAIIHGKALASFTNPNIRPEPHERFAK